MDFSFLTSRPTPPTPPTPPNTSVRAALTQMFDDMQWRYTTHEASGIISALVDGRNGRWVIKAYACPEDVRASVIAELGVRVPEDQRVRAAELVVRMNRGLWTGRFELDMDQGWLSFCVGLDSGREPVTPALLRRLVLCACAMSDRYLPAIEKVVHGDAVPADAVAVVEVMAAA